MDLWNNSDDITPLSPGRATEVEHEQRLQLPLLGNLSHTSKRLRAWFSPPRQTEAVKAKRQYHSLVLKFVIELAIDDMLFIYSHDLQKQRGGKIETGKWMKVSQGWWCGQEVAIKTLKDDRIPRWADKYNTVKKAEYRKAIKDLIYELRIMSHKSLRGHRNLVTLLSIGFEPTYINSNGDQSRENTNLEAFSPILVLPWALSDLDSLWDKWRLEHPNEAAEIVSDIADGLTALHKHDIVHCDIKPANILLFKDPLDERKLIAKIADFGAISSKHNNRYSVAGTSVWKAPECFQDAPEGCPDAPLVRTEVDFESGRARDVYSFGLVAAYVAIEGQIDEEWPDDSWEVDERRDQLNQAITNRYHDKWPEQKDLVSRWHTLLKNTLIENPQDRMDPDLLGTVRTRLLGSDPFQDEKQLYHDQIIPFTGRRGWKDGQRHWLRFCSRMGTKRTCKAIKVLPQLIKDQLCEDYNNFNTWNVHFSRDFAYKRAASRMSFIAQAIGDDETCLPIKIDHKAILLMACNAPGSKGIAFFETWVAIFLNCALIFTPTLRKKVSEKLAPYISGAWEEDENQSRLNVWKAAQNGNVSVVEKMVKKNPGLLRTSHLGRMLIHQAATFDQVRVVEFLLRKNESLLHAKTAIELTPLHVAVGGQAVGCVRFLLENGASLELKGTHGNTPLDHGLGLYVWAMFVPGWSTEGYQKVIDILREQNLPNGALLSLPALLKAGVDQFIAGAYEWVYQAAVSWSIASIIWFCFGSFLPWWSVLALLVCQFCVRVRLEEGGVDMFFFLRREVMYAVLFMTSLASQDLWLSLHFRIILWLESSRTFYASRFQDEASLLWQATGHGYPFESYNPEHRKEIKKIIYSGILEINNSRSGRIAGQGHLSGSSFATNMQEPTARELGTPYDSWEWEEGRHGCKRVRTFGKYEEYFSAGKGN